MGAGVGSVPRRVAPGFAPTGRGDGMRMLLRLGPLAAAFWFGLPAAQAAHCGACRYPTPCVAPEQCCPPVIATRVAYQPVSELKTEVCYRPVTRTVYESQPITTYKTCYEQHVEAVPYTVTKPVVEHFDTVHRYVVNRPVYE